MIRDLRKGQSSVYLQYGSYGGETIGAKGFQAEQRNDLIIFRFTLSPVDGNQKSDAQNLFSRPLQQVHVSDDHIITNLAKFVQHRRDQFKDYAVEIVTDRGLLAFDAKLHDVGGYAVGFSVAQRAN